MDFALIGGDMRQAKLGELLAADGHRVKTAGIDSVAVTGTERACGIAGAVEGVQFVILPLPATLGGELINAPLADNDISIHELKECLSAGQTVLAGRADEKLKACLNGSGVSLIDYFEREELTIKNAAATAEGAVQLLMEELPVTLQNTKCLIIGFGRIGKLLALKLRALGADVTVSARKFSDFAWIEAIGCRCADTRKLDGNISGYEAVINTVPAKILNESILSQMRDGCLCLDLASKPGGMDFEAASRLGVRAVWALSLPGRVAPVTAGMAIRDAIYNIITELECAD
ncbi:MAG: dipicolinate synthase subunit DpsA [Oscillospiraceae bacterium]